MWNGLTLRLMLVLGTFALLPGDAHAQVADGAATKPQPGRPRNAPAPPATKPQDDVLSLDAVIDDLTEASEDLTSAGSRFEVLRPHPLVRRLQPGQALAVLKRLSKPFTGDPVRDTYIRYHLMYVVIADAHGEKAISPGQFREVAAALPTEIKFDLKSRGSQRYEPPEVYARYRKLVESCRVTTGYPPFQKTINAPESFEYMDAARRKEAEAAWAEAQSLVGKFKRVNTAAEPDAHLFNTRMGWLTWMLRQTRGETLYGQIQCGDPAQLTAVVKQIGQTAASDPATASDLLEFFNAAHLDGWLSLYDAPKLKELGGLLQRSMMAADAALKAANQPSRDFADRSFAVAAAMVNGTVITRGFSPIMKRESEPLPPLRPRTVTPETITLAMIDDAIERGVAVLARYRPPEADLGTLSWRISNNSERPQHSTVGHQSLMVWAMVAAGEKPHDFWLQKRAFQVAMVDSNSTYDRAIRLQAMSQLPPGRWQAAVARDVEWLGLSMTDKGSFNARGTGAKVAGYGDNANSQYALLGLWAAQQAGYEVPQPLWKAIDTYWRQAQFPADKGSDAAGWAVRSHASLEPGANMKDFANQVVGPMTAAGVLSLSIAERYTVGPRQLGVGNRLSPELAKGLNWLDTRYDINDIDGDSDLYYYLWTIQNVGQASGYRTFNKTDWFRQATAKLLNEQQASGTWKGPKGELVSTSFALLYLARARGPLAVCKVRFDTADAKPGTTSYAWNNRPNDMVNFVEYAGRQFEAPTSWQIADLDQPVYELAESAMLYLATDKAFTLKPEQIERLRDYINAGGMLVMAPEGGNLSLPAKSMRALAQQLFPDREMQKLDGKHLFYSLFQKVQPTTPVFAVSNALRPLVVLVEKDISRDLQANAAKNRESFNLLTNLYLYAAGMNTKRPRIQSNYVIPATDVETKQSLKVARIQFAGEFDPEPTAWTQLKAIAARKHGVDVQVVIVPPEKLTDEKMAFLTLNARGKLSSAEAAALRKWIDAGGVLWIDTAAGANVGSDPGEVIKLLGFNPTDVSATTNLPIITGQGIAGGYDNTKPTYRSYTDGAMVLNVEAVLRDGKPAVYFTRGDLTSGLAGINHWAIAGLSVDSARQLVINSVLQSAEPSPKAAGKGAAE